MRNFLFTVHSAVTFLRYLTIFTIFCIYLITIIASFFIFIVNFITYVQNVYSIFLLCKPLFQHKKMWITLITSCITLFFGIFRPFSRGKLSHNFTSFGDYFQTTLFFCVLFINDIFQFSVCKKVPHYFLTFYLQKELPSFSMTVPIISF